MNIKFVALIFFGLAAVLIIKQKARRDITQDELMEDNARATHLFLARQK